MVDVEELGSSVFVIGDVLMPTDEVVVSPEPGAVELEGVEGGELSAVSVLSCPALDGGAFGVAIDEAKDIASIVVISNELRLKDGVGNEGNPADDRVDVRVVSGLLIALGGADVIAGVEEALSTGIEDDPLGELVEVIVNKLLSLLLVTGVVIVMVDSEPDVSDGDAVLDTLELSVLVTVDSGGALDGDEDDVDVTSVLGLLVEVNVDNDPDCAGVFGGYDTTPDAPLP